MCIELGEGRYERLNTRRLENEKILLERSNYLENIISGDIGRFLKINVRIATASGVFNKRRRLLRGKLTMDLRKGSEKYLELSVAFNRTEMWSLRKKPHNCGH